MKERKTFMVPKIPDDMQGVDYYKFFDAYVQAIHTDVKPSAKQPFWLTAKVMKTKTFFKRQNLGINEIYGNPRHIAELCGYPDPELYTGHAHRRTCLTTMADRGATGAQLRNMANHVSEKCK